MEATFAFLDLAGFSALTEAHGDEAAADLSTRFAELVRAALAGDGRLVKTIGDAVLVAATDPGAAVRFVGRVFARLAAEPDFPILRAGLHHGAAVEREGDVFGTAVNLAARVTAQAQGGQVLATEAVAAAARAAGVEVSDLGSVSFRNLSERVRLFALHVAAADAGEVVDPVCRMRVARDRAAGHLRVEGVDYWFCSLECVQRFAAAPATFVSQARKGGHS